MKILKKISKGFLISIIFLVFILSVLYFMVQSRPFQNYAAQKVVNYLAKEFKTKVSLRSIDFQLINTLVLEGLTVEDQKGDTLVHFGKLKANFNYKVIFNSKLQLASISKASLEDTKINLLLHPNDSNFNFQFLVDYFSSSDTSVSTKSPFKLIIKELKLTNVDFRFQDKSAPPAVGRRFDESNMHFKGITTAITPFKLIGDSLYLDIHNMSFKERSGFEMVNFSAETILSSTKMEFSSLTLKTPNSSVSNYLKFSYNGWDKFSDFVDAVQWEANLNNSIVGMKDVAFFSDDLKKYTFPITVSGGVKGTLAALDCKKMVITVGGINTLKGDIRLKKITDPDNLNFDVNMVSLMVNPSSIQSLTKIELPVEIIRLGSVRYSGTFAGGLADFTTKGLIETSIGKIRTDLNLKFPSGKPERYKGEIEVFNFNMGKMLNDAALGNVTLFAKVDGRGFSIEDLNTQLEANVQGFDYNGYTYTNIDLDGVLDKKLFNGNLEIKDPNANLSFVGMFDLNNENPLGDFKAKLGVVNLQKLGFGDINIKQISDVNIAFEGKDIDNMNTKGVLTNIVLEKNDTIYTLGNINIDAYGPHTGRAITLTSDLGNISINGQFRISQMSSLSNNLLYNLFPEHYSHLYTRAEPVNVRFDIDIQDSKLLSALLLPEARFEKFTATGVYNSANQNMDIAARADYFRYSNYTVRDLKLESIKQPGQRLAVTSTVAGFYVNDSLITDKLDLTADLGGNDINFRLNAADTTHDLSIKSGGNVSFSKGAIALNLMQTTVFLYNKPWVINDNNRITFYQSDIRIDSFRISNGLQSIAIDGLAGANTVNDLNVKIAQLNLADLNPLLSKWGMQLQGLTDGKMVFNGSSSRPVIVSDITIKNLVYNTDSIGDVTLETDADDGPYKMAVNGNIKNGLINDLVLTGNVDLTPGNDKIDLLLTLTETNIKPFEVFTVGIFSNLNGIANGRIKVKGALSKPDITGNIELAYASLYMDYLGLPLKIEKANIAIDDKKIDLGTFDVFDKYGSKAIAGGEIRHKNFGDLRFNIFMKELINFNCMDLSETQADVFFGTAFVDGSVKITGPIDDLNLNIKAKTRPRTVISLPLASTTENTGPDFIEVIDLRADVITKSKKLSGVTMNFAFTVTKDARIRLIFDEKFNDVIEATGEGSINMELNTYGDFYMFGQYIISSGYYNFSALNNIVNTDLKVANGSSIRWNGNPLDAYVDILATTAVTADASVILTENALATQGAKNVKVDCEIYMKENLFQPAITLGIDLSKENQPGLFANAELASVINRIKADPEETNKQFVSLLVFNSFAPLNSGESGGGSFDKGVSSLTNSISVFVTNQVNNWLRQIDPNWELGVDYKTASNNNSNQQLILSLKRKLFNDRVEIGLGYEPGGVQSYDVNVSYKVSKDGRLLLRGFNRKANDPLSTTPYPINTSGVGFYYRREIDYFFPNWQKRHWNKAQSKKFGNTPP